MRDLDDQELRNNCSLKTISRWVQQNASSSFYDQATASRLPTTGTHAHRRGNWRPQISARTKNRIRQLFDDNSRMSLRAAAAETSVAHATIWNFLRKELGRFPSKLQMATSLTEDHKMRRESFAQYCRRELRNGAGFLERIVFSDEFTFSLSGSVDKQNYRIWEVNARTESSKRFKSSHQLCYGAPCLKSR